MLVRLVSVFFVLISMHGCVSSKPQESRILAAQEYYLKGLQFLHVKKYKKAADEFANIYFQHPGDPLSSKAEFMEAYAMYLAGKHEDASDILENAIKLHPSSSNIADMYYLKAMADYAQRSGTKHDQSQSQNARRSLLLVINKFPNTHYANDATEKLNVVLEELAGYEMQVGRYYLYNKNALAALNRFNNVVTDFASTLQYPEALYRMAESHALLGNLDESRKYLVILNEKYYGSIWRKYGMSLAAKIGIN